MTENLIILVRKHPCLYDTKDKSYKNIAKKTRLWEHIGKEINETGDVAKKKWKSLRDNYMRYKKEVAGLTGQATKKFTRWPWASQLQFLDITLTDRERSSNVGISTAETSSLDAESLDISPLELQNPKTSPPDTPPPESFSPESPPPESPPLESPPPELPLPELTPRPVIRSRIKKYKKINKDMSKVIHIRQNKNKQDYDAVDHLFQSYAHTFKGFSKKSQIKAKVELAKLFARIETEEMEENSQISKDSPHYCTINIDDPLV